MQTEIKAWGNSASIRIPAALMKAAHLKLNTKVKLREDKGRLIIEPIQKNFYDLDQLLAGITVENCHTEIDFGKPQGRELL